MPPIIATRTLALIAETMHRDQGSSFRRELGKAVLECPDAYREDDEAFRSHLGASVIGRECARELWYGFHWGLEKKHEGRLLRLFNRGHLEEARFIALLRMIGFEMWQTDANGNQFRISDHGGHFGGSMDGVGRGCPDLPEGEVFVTEFKTHGDKSFQKLLSDGVLTAKWEHYVQMQLYMGKNGINWALYLAVNKNDDELYAELVPFDSGTFQRYLDRGALIVMATEPPPKINQSPGWFKCKFCDYRELCHLDATPARNCRTCLNSRPAAEAAWECQYKGGMKLTKAEQLAGCKAYTVNPAIKGV